MTDEDKVEVLRCAADLCSGIDPGAAISDAKDWLEYTCTTSAFVEAAGRVGVDVLVMVDTLGTPERFKETAEAKRAALLEAAQRIEEGWVPE